jgi:PAS domain S-box-containing protein
MRGLGRFKYLITLVIVALAALGQYALWPWIDDSPFLLFYPAVILAALYGDGISAIWLSAAIAQYYFVAPRHSFTLHFPNDLVRLALFVGSSYMIRQLTVRLARALQKARNAESRLSTTLNSIADAVIATDAQGRVEFMNPVAEHLTEWTMAEARGKPLPDVFRIVDHFSREAIEGPVRRVMAEGATVGVAGDTLLLGRYGKESSIEDSAAPIREEESRQIEGVVLVFRDITAKHAQDERMEQAFRDLQESEARMRSVLDNALDAVVGMDSDGIVTQWNPQAEKIFGFSRDEAIGRRMSEIIIPHAYRQAHEAGLLRYLATGRGKMLNNRIQITALNRNGREFPIELTITPIRSGAKQHFAAFIRDISERQRIEKDLLTKSDVLENSLNGFDIVDEDGKFVYANRAYLRMWGYDRLDEVIGTSPASHCADPATPAQIVAELKARGECNIEFLARRKDGSTFDVHMWARLAHDPDGREIYPSTSVDITERKRAEEALRQAVQTRDEFISICSHELKTPITSMKLQFQMAERQLKRGDRRVFSEGLAAKRIESTNRQLDRMTRLIEEMLDVTRFSQGRLRLDLQVNDLSALLEEMSDRFTEQFALMGTTIGLEAEPHVMVEFDRYRIEQVISNLLTNSIKYGAKNPVVMSLKRAGGRVQVRVTDRGVGIKADSLDRIFNRFERAISANNISGLGLGLYISRQIIEAHGGRIWAESKLGEGSTFVMELPEKQPEESRSRA